MVKLVQLIAILTFFDEKCVFFGGSTGDGQVDPGGRTERQRRRRCDRRLGSLRGSEPKVRQGLNGAAVSWKEPRGWCF